MASNTLQISILSNTVSVHPSIIPSNIGSTVTIIGSALEFIDALEFVGKPLNHSYSEKYKQITSFVMSSVGQHVLRGYVGGTLQLQINVDVRPMPHGIALSPAQVAFDSHALLTLTGIHFDSCVDLKGAFGQPCSPVFISDSLAVFFMLRAYSCRTFDSLQ